MEAPDGKYWPLYNRLVRLQETGETIVRLTFKAIERLIGDALPRSAYNHRQWWENQNNPGSRHCRAWLAAGWKVESVDFVAGEVTFVRL